MVRKYNIEHCKNFAKVKDGDCLSKVYTNTKTKMLWECKKGHTWEATFGGVKIGTWCPECAGNIKFNIKIAQEVAKSRGGLCLSKKYTNIMTKMLWKCKEEHTWSAHLHNIKNCNSWCPECFNASRSEKMKLPNGLLIAQKNCS